MDNPCSKLEDKIFKEGCYEYMYAVCSGRWEKPTNYNSHNDCHNGWKENLAEEVIIAMDEVFDEK